MSSKSKHTFRPKSASSKLKTHSKDLQVLKQLLTDVKTDIPEDVEEIDNNGDDNGDDCEADNDNDCEDGNGDDCEDDNGDDCEEDEGDDCEEDEDECEEDLFSILEYFFIENKKNRNIVDVLVEIKRSLDTHNKLILEVLKRT